MQLLTSEVASHGVGESLSFFLFFSFSFSLLDTPRRTGQAGVGFSNKMAAKRTSFSCVGTVDDSSYHMAVAVLKSAEALGYVDERDLECTPLLEPEFDKYMMDAKPRLGGSAFAHSTSPFICMVMS
jgi:hypothetical protein